MGGGRHTAFARPAHHRWAKGGLLLSRADIFGNRFSSTWALRYMLVAHATRLVRKQSVRVKYLVVLSLSSLTATRVTTPIQVFRDN